MPAPDLDTLIPGLLATALDGAIKAAVAAGMPEEEARAKVRATVIQHAGFLRGELAASDIEAAAARAAAKAHIAAGAPVSMPFVATPGSPDPVGVLTVSHVAPGVGTPSAETVTTIVPPSTASLIGGE